MDKGSGRFVSLCNAEDYKESKAGLTRLELATSCVTGRRRVLSQRKSSILKEPLSRIKRRVVIHIIDNAGKRSKRSGWFHDHTFSQQAMAAKIHPETVSTKIFPDPHAPSPLVRVEATIRLLSRDVMDGTHSYHQHLQMILSYDANTYKVKYEFRLNVSARLQFPPKIWSTSFPNHLPE